MHGEKGRGEERDSGGEERGRSEEKIQEEKGGRGEGRRGVEVYSSDFRWDLGYLMILLMI